MAYTSIDNPELYFQVKLYTGNGGTNAITFDGDENMSPDLVWLKMRSNADNHTIFNTTSGATKRIFSNLTQQESTESTSLTSFDSDGFTLGSDALANASSRTFVAWAWKESATAGFDILTYTGTGSTQNVSHNLSAVPHFHIIKDRNNAENFFVYHKSTGNTGGLFLNTTGAFVDNAGYYNDTSPTSSVFTVKDTGGVNHDTTSNGHLAFLWSEKQGFSKFGSYEGNGSTSTTGGPFIYTGFSPSLIIIKDVDATANWEMFDNKRIVGGYPAELHPHASAVESTPPGDRRVLFKSNGFKIDTTYAAPINASGETYVYMAWAEAPFVNSKGVPANAR